MVVVVGNHGDADSRGVGRLGNANTAQTAMQQLRSRCEEL